MKSSCSSVLKLLEKYFDQETSDQERTLVEEHLHHCPTCQEGLKLLEGFKKAIKNPIGEAIEKEDFPWIWEKIERGIRLEKRLSWRESLRSWLDITPLLRRKVWIPAVAAVIILILITVPFLYKKTPSYSEGSVVEYVESQDYDVMVYQSEKANVTVIWLFEGSEQESPTS